MRKTLLIGQYASSVPESDAVNHDRIAMSNDSLHCVGHSETSVLKRSTGVYDDRR